MTHRALLVLMTSLLLACGGGEPVDPTDPPEPTASVTWYRDVLPIAQEACLGCHNDAAPTFSMTSWSEELSARAPLIADYTQQGIMPPWKPAAGCNSFVGDRSLDGDDIGVFAAWAADGGVAGDPNDAPPAPTDDDGLEWVDRTMEMAEAYTPQPLADDPFNDLRCFVFDPQLQQDELLIGFDVRPGELKVVHHVLLYVADAAEATMLDAADDGPGYECFGGPQANSAQTIGGWVPGMPANSYPTSTGIPLAMGKMVIAQIHYNLAQSGPLPDQTSLDLQLANAPMDHEAQLIKIVENDFDIPPMAQGYTAAQVMDVPAKATVWAVAPHMHLLGRQIRAEVQHSDGSSTCLVEIPDWDFNWQQFYFFDSPVGIPVEPGDQVSMSCTWDNPLDKSVGWGDGTEDEMCIGYFYVTGGHVQ